MKLLTEDNFYCYVTSTEEVERGKYLNFVVDANTQFGPLRFKFWDFKNKERFPNTGSYLKISITDLEEANKELLSFKTVSLDSTSKNKPYFAEASPVEEDAVPKEIREKINRDKSDQIKLALDALKKDSYWTQKSVHEFLLSFVEGNMDRFASVPAAVKNHHAYKGGLLVHSSEVFFNSYSLANSLCNKRFYSSNVDTDCLYLSAWLHDAGKMEVYYMEGSTPRMNSEKESLIGHPTISNLMFVEAANRHGLDKTFMDAVSHCILSHHRRRKWGAVVRPKTVEANILCEADLTSSKISY